MHLKIELCNHMPTDVRMMRLCFIFLRNHSISWKTIKAKFYIVLADQSNLTCGLRGRRGHKPNLVVDQGPPVQTQKGIASKLSSCQPS